MARKQKADEVKEGLPAWMGTYGDLVTLLLCFFVLLFATSSVDAAKFQAMAMSFNPSLVVSDSGGSEGVNEMQGSGIMQMPNIDNAVNDSRENYKKMQEELNQMASEFKTYLAEENLNDSVSVEIEDTYLKINFKDGILFDSGEATLTKKARKILTGIGAELSSYQDNDIKVEGHTDNTPIKTAEFKSNYYLSAARAIAVLEFLKDNEGVSPEHLSAEGMGEYKPIAPNDTKENRAKNRRVEIKIDSKYSN